MRFLLKVTIGILAVAVVFVGLAAAEVWQTSKLHERPASDAIVVMGAAQYNGRPSAVFQARLDHARTLFDEKAAPLIVVLGGKRPGDRFTEAQAGAAYLEKSLPAPKVTGVKSGSNTLESFRNFTGLAEERGIKKILIVSDPLHLARAREIARNFGFEAAVSGSKIPESADRKQLVFVRESLTLAHYRLFRGN